MNTSKMDKQNNFGSRPELDKYIKKHDLEKFIEELKKYATKELLEKDIRTIREELLQKTRDIGALVEHQEDKFKATMELWMILDERGERMGHEYRERIEKQDAVNNATWFRLGKLEDRVLGDSEESFGDIAFA
jgi:uncharacterized membrane protein YhiD involved in acid resistance